ncbi:MAG: SAM-dependent chlorinase/fluorinase [Magnetococcales bacterium]|nr:SAM-dependent chlorinase/fluorinase [Magnetococcales bacterium]
MILLTDFGQSDPYVGQVKGVLHRLCPGAACIDLSHDLAPFDVVAGAWLIDRCRPHMPESAVWLCVVDPGVGSARRILAAARGRTRMVGPDNGLLSAFLREPDCRVVAVDCAPYAGAAATFHGRDIMAPVVGRLLRGAALESLGAPVGDPVLLDGPGWEQTGSGAWRTRVMLVDRYGNLVTGLPAAAMSAAGAAVQGWVEQQPCGALAITFAALPEGAAGMVLGGFGTLEVVVNRGSAARRFGVGAGAEVTVRAAPVVFP